MTSTSIGTCLRSQRLRREMGSVMTLCSGMTTVSKTGFDRSSQLLPLEQLLCRFYCLSNETGFMARPGCMHGAADLPEIATGSFRVLSAKGRFDATRLSGDSLRIARGLPHWLILRF